MKLVPNTPVRKLRGRKIVATKDKRVLVLMLRKVVRASIAPTRAYFSISVPNRCEQTCKSQLGPANTGYDRAEYGIEPVRG